MFTQLVCTIRTVDNLQITVVHLLLLKLLKVGKEEENSAICQKGHIIITEGLYIMFERKFVR